MEVLRFLLVLISFLIGIVLIPLGGYYLLTHSPFIWHSYTQLSFFYVGVGLLFLASGVVGWYELVERPFKDWQFLLVLISFGVLIVGRSLYQYGSSLVYEAPIVRSSQLGAVFFSVSSDYWSSAPAIPKPNQKFSIASTQPFYVVLGSVDAESAIYKDGQYQYAIMTTDTDFTSRDRVYGITQVTTKDSLQIRLTSDATAKVAEVGFTIEDRDNKSLVEEKLSEKNWMLVMYGIFVLVIIGAGGITGYYVVSV